MRLRRDLRRPVGRFSVSGMVATFFSPHRGRSSVTVMLLDANSLWVLVPIVWPANLENRWHLAAKTLLPVAHRNHARAIACNERYRIAWRGCRKSRRLIGGARRAVAYQRHHPAGRTRYPVCPGSTVLKQLGPLAALAASELHQHVGNRQRAGTDYGVFGMSNPG
jgi:hypothetical protein